MSTKKEVKRYMHFVGNEKSSVLCVEKTKVHAGSSVMQFNNIKHYKCITIE
jgi:uncharacterized protein YqhQ